MKHGILVFVFLIIFFDLIAQKEKVKTYYSNGKLKLKGSMYSFGNYDNRIPKSYNYFKSLKKKDGEWKYYYQNGNLSRIESYKATPDLKNLDDLKHGRWVYYNEQGIKYREDFYNEGFIYNSVREIYNKTRYSGAISIINSQPDTILNSPLTIDSNLIINPEFDFYYYKPVQIVYSGQSKIEDWIPFWVTPGKSTPDYISNLRYIDVLNYNYLFDFPLPDTFNYVGIALFKESEPYSEFVQGKLIKPLIKGQKYCLKTSVILSSYSGFSINRFACYLSQKQIAITDKNETTIIPQVIFSDLALDDKQFVSLCKDFTADGGERFITIGRFLPSEKLDIQPRYNIPKSQFGLEKSAYYLFDNVELYEINDPMECSCILNNGPADSVKPIPSPSLTSRELDFSILNQGNVLILKNVSFEFNSSTLLADADTILIQLLSWLKANPKTNILITGHTDNIGSDDYNLGLSLDRAKSVYNWLITRGVDPSRLEYKGLGKTQPLYEESTGEFRALNRRVEIKIIQP